MDVENRIVWNQELNTMTFYTSFELCSGMTIYEIDSLPALRASVIGQKAKWLCSYYLNRASIEKVIISSYRFVVHKHPAFSWEETKLTPDQVISSITENYELENLWTGKGTAFEDTKFQKYFE